MPVIRIAKDYPSSVTCALAGLTLAHWYTSSQLEWVPSIAARLSALSFAWSIYIGAAAVVAISAGFAGVVVVFAQTPGNEAFERLRRAGGGRLQSNWLVLVTSPMLAASVMLVATVSAAIGDGTVAAWAFEFACLCALHGAIRMVWLLRALMRIVAAEDQAATAVTAPPLSLSALLEDRKAAGQGT